MVLSRPEGRWWAARESAKKKRGQREKEKAKRDGLWGWAGKEREGGFGVSFFVFLFQHTTNKTKQMQPNYDAQSLG
jgi:hypothetical protein